MSILLILGHKSINFNLFFDHYNKTIFVTYLYKKKHEYY